MIYTDSKGKEHSFYSIYGKFPAGFLSLVNLNNCSVCWISYIENIFLYTESMHLFKFLLNYREETTNYMFSFRKSMRTHIDKMKDLLDSLNKKYYWFEAPSSHPGSMIVIFCVSVKD